MPIFDVDVVSENQITDVQTLSVGPSYHKNLQHCGNQSCSARVYFAYNLTCEGDECNPN